MYWDCEKYKKNNRKEEKIKENFRNLKGTLMQI